MYLLVKYFTSARGKLPVLVKVFTNCKTETSSEVFTLTNSFQHHFSLPATNPTRLYFPFVEALRKETGSAVNKEKN